MIVYDTPVKCGAKNISTIPWYVLPKYPGSNFSMLTPTHFLGWLMSEHSKHRHLTAGTAAAAAAAAAAGTDAH